MKNILIKPQLLRYDAQMLSQKARSILSAIENVDKIINDLSSIKFSGNRASSLKAKYARNRDQLFAASKLINAFANELIAIANIFEKADSVSEVPNASLYVKGDGDGSAIHPSDITQSYELGDCYLVASIAALALQNPELIKNMIRENGDGTYTVTFYEKKKILGLFDNGYEKTEITVSDIFSIQNGTPIYARYGDVTPTETEIWPMVIEKAYAQWKGGYDNIDGGYIHNAMEALTGMDSKDYNPSFTNIQDLANQHNNGSIITLGSLPDLKIIPDAADSNPLYMNDTLVTGHAYFLTNVDSTAGTVSIRNPWGWDHPEIVLPFDQFQQAFLTISVNG